MHGMKNLKSFYLLEDHTSKSVVTVQRAFRAKYAKDSPTDKTIRAWYKQFTETGCLCKQKSSGRPLTAEDDVERCTHVDACVARTSISYRCVPCHPLCTHRTSLVVQKNTFSVFL